MLRGLHPDGTTVLTFFQRHTDLDAASPPHAPSRYDELGPPAKIFTISAVLSEDVRHGSWHHYGHDELIHPQAHADAGPIQFFSILDNQLRLALVRKTKSTGWNSPSGVIYFSPREDT